jgi:hypothetical protein
VQIKEATMKTITEAWIEEHHPCEDGVKWYNSRTDKTPLGLLDGLIAEKRYEWGFRFMARILDRKDRIRYAVFAAEQVLGIFEKKFPDDKRPRLAIESAKKVLVKDTAETRYAAESAMFAARYAESAASSVAESAARSAESAARSAESAARYAESAAESAAWSVESAARSAARSTMLAAESAVRSAVQEKMRLKILEFGRGLVEKNV